MNELFKTTICPLDSHRTFFADEFLERGYNFSKQLFKHDPQTDAIITTDDLLAERCL